LFDFMATTTMSIRVSTEMRRWLERRSKGFGTSGSAAARLLEEARRRELFPAIDFRDTPSGRMAWVNGTRIPVAMVLQIAETADAAQVAKHYSWPMWKVESVLGYLRTYRKEIEDDLQALLEAEDAISMSLPGVQAFVM
jgi:uncharacterized protein (DUF433 family)